MIEKVQPGLTETELAEIEEVDFAWRDDDSVERNDLSSNPLKASKERDQQATWLIDPETVEVIEYLILVELHYSLLRLIIFTCITKIQPKVALILFMVSMSLQIVKISRLSKFDFSTSLDFRGESFIWPSHFR